MPLQIDTPLPPDNERVNAERDRRIEAGALVAVTGYGDIPLQGRPADQLNLLALKDTARDLIAAEITAPIIPFRDAANAMHMLTAAQVAELADKGKSWVSAVYQASWALKALDPLPEDFSDDSHWEVS